MAQQLLKKSVFLFFNNFCKGLQIENEDRLGINPQQLC